MKKRIFYVIGTIVFFTALIFTVQFVENGTEENNNLAVKNLEALADMQPLLCSFHCTPEYDNCCMLCIYCQLVLDYDEASTMADSCTP